MEYSIVFSQTHSTVVHLTCHFTNGGSLKNVPFLYFFSISLWFIDNAQSLYTKETDMEINHQILETNRQTM